MDSKLKKLKPQEIHLVSKTDSEEFNLLSWALNRSSVIGLDAEWKPSHTKQSSFPTVSLLQIACRVNDNLVEYTDSQNDLWVFLVDLLNIHLSSIWELLRDMFISPDILKLGFRFKQDLIYLSSTFCSNGCNLVFDKVEPYLDITTIYYHLQQKQPGRKLSKDTKSLASICEEVLGVSLSKELQCSDWSHRPLTEDQKTYAAADAQCLLEIFTVFQGKVLKEGYSSRDVTELQPANALHGLKDILVKPDVCDNVLRLKFCQASDIVRSTIVSEIHPINFSVVAPVSRVSFVNTVPFGVSLSNTVRKYGERILLKESDRKPKTSKKKGKRPSSVGLGYKEKRVENCSDWQGPPPWDLSLGGDGCPKFLCDVMVEGLAKHLRCVGIDAAIPYSRKPEARQLIDQADKEKRVLLTRDAKLLRHEYLIRNQIYRVKSLLKNDQLTEVIETFKLKISEDQLMSRCTKCNGRFIQKPLSTEEAIEAAKGFQIIPDCLFNRNLEFWQCTDCNQLYWEGTQYHNAVQKFIDVCKLNY
ncbi:3'-5' exonuclease domain [Macleaya cordata]|uniref:3'-5' exonuclease domain n=1 Tax=Macleaya cordata TaxID=56857 RepID=A0A200Q766_MACCD|nr:3'-5' exonuclease domain [Macleaya cordata]